MVRTLTKYLKFPVGGVLRRKCNCYLRENIEKRSVDVGSTGDSLGAVTNFSTGE